MPWVRLDDEFAEHPKVTGVGPLAGMMQVAALCYCNRFLTDGFVPKGQVPKLVSFDGYAFNGVQVTWQGVLQDLLVAEMWSEVDGGYLVHDYLEYQPSRDEVMRSRNASTDRKELRKDPELLAAVKERDRDHCRYCGRQVDWLDRRSARGATYDHVVPGGGNSLDNLVVACRECNNRKNNRTPQQAGMDLMEPIRNSSGTDQVPSKTGSRTDQKRTKGPNPNPNPIPDPGSNPETREGDGGTNVGPEAGASAAPSVPAASAAAVAPPPAPQEDKSQAAAGDPLLRALGAMRQLPGYRAKPDDLAWLQDLRGEYDGLVTRSEVLKCRDWWLGQDGPSPPKGKRPNWRSRLRNWMDHAKNTSKGVRGHAADPGVDGDPFAFEQRIADRQHELRMSPG